MPSTDVDLVTDEPTTDKSVETLLDLMEAYIKDLAGDDPPPNVIVISLPEEIEEACFDEDIQTDTRANQCPECNGHVTTKVKETV